MKTLVLLMVGLLPYVVVAQRTAHETTERRENGWGIVKDGNGERIRKYFSPSPKMALEALLAERGTTAAKMVLRQKAELRLDSELDAFADDLARLVLESSSKEVTSDALMCIGSG
ncbi:MAG: hypothetical protein OXI04_08830 [Bacteroidota bacterium]|nr:hypothetical protein [Bacteroidota bacterium]